MKLKTIMPRRGPERTPEEIATMEKELQELDVFLDIVHIDGDLRPVERMHERAELLRKQLANVRVKFPQKMAGLLSSDGINVNGRSAPLQRKDWQIKNMRKSKEASK